MLSWRLKQPKRIRSNSDPLSRKFKQIAESIKRCFWKVKCTRFSTLVLTPGNNFARVVIEIPLMGQLKYITFFVPAVFVSWSGGNETLNCGEDVEGPLLIIGVFCPPKNNRRDLMKLILGAHWEDQVMAGFSWDLEMGIVQSIADWFLSMWLKPPGLFCKW